MRTQRKYWSLSTWPGHGAWAGQFLVFQLLVVVVVLFAVAAVSVTQSTSEFREVRGQRMIAVAENMASTPIVRDRFADPFAAKVLAPEVDRAVALSGADLAEILDPDGTIRVSSDPSRVGSRMDLGPSRADEGRAWFGDDDIDGVHSLVGQVPILSIDGDVLAVASVSERYPSVWELLSGAGERLLFYLGLGAALGLLASWLLSRRIKRHTRGLEVAEIAGLADHREALLHSIREGVVAVNNEGDVTLLNDSAQELLGVDGDAVGRRVDNIGLDPAVVDFLLSGDDGRDVVIATRTRVSGVEPAVGHQSGPGDRHGDDDARQHRTRGAAGPVVVAQERHRHVARADPRVRQPAAHHLGARPARRVRLRARPRRHARPGGAPRSTTPSPVASPTRRWRRC